MALIILIIVMATAGSGGKAAEKVASFTGAPYEDVSAGLHYMRIRQGMDPEAVPSLAIIGVRRGAARGAHTGKRGR